MNAFHRSIEERIGPYNLQLLLIPTIIGSSSRHSSWKSKSVLEEINEPDYELKEKHEVVFFINQNLPRFVPIITVFLK